MLFTESETVELKPEVVSDICKEVIAFANTKGGTLYIGIADDGTITGIEKPDSVILQLSNMVRDSIKPDITMFVHYETKIIESKQVIKVSIQRGTDRPYYLAGKGLKPSGVYVRNGTSSDPATDSAIRKMIKATDGDCFENRCSLEQNLTFAAAAELFSKRNIPFDMAKMQTLGLLSPDGIWSNVGMLLSDQCTSTIKAAVFAGADKGNFQDRREFGGSLFKQMEETYAYLDLLNQTKATIKGLYRTDARDYPEEALREALMNSLVHREYSISASTLISVYEDRIEFVSAGGLPEGIELEDVLLGLSVCRNAKLAAVFYRLKLIEAYGTGLPKIMKSYEGSGLNPVIKATANAFKITLPNRNAHKERTAPPVASGSQSEGDKILAFIAQNGHIARSDADKLLGVSQSTSVRILGHMVAQGLLYKDGRGNKTQYKRKV